MFDIISTCKGGGYRYCRTEPPHPNRNAKGLYPLHRVLLENKLGRLLTSSEIAHHVDEVKENDDPNNIELKTWGEHTSEHMVSRRALLVNLKCYCGREFKLKESTIRFRMSRSVNGQICCSRHCARSIQGLVA